MSVTPITVNGNMFFSGADRWSPKGIDYQPQDGVDPISDNNLATIQALLSADHGFSALGINCIRVCQVDPDSSHDQVMQALSDAGIYVLVGAVNGETGIPRDATTVPPRTVARVKAVADAFARYDNVLGLNISNELLDGSGDNDTLISIVRQVKVELQEYMAGKEYRAIPIGCALRDVPQYTFPASKAYACGSASQRMDFIGYNTYRWVVDNGSPPSAGTVNAYYLLYHQFKGFPVPVMITETGAGCSGGRDWSQVAYIFGQTDVSPTPPGPAPAPMSDAISGMFAFRYYNGPDEHGLVKPLGSTQPTPMVTGEFGGFDDLRAAYNNVTTFPGSPNGVSTTACSGSSSGGLAKDTTVTMTNSITNPVSGRNITFNYNMSATDGVWLKAVTIAALGRRVVGAPAQGQGQDRAPRGLAQGQGHPAGRSRRRLRLRLSGRRRRHGRSPGIARGRDRHRRHLDPRQDRGQGRGQGGRVRRQGGARPAGSASGFPSRTSRSARAARPRAPSEWAAKPAPTAACRGKTAWTSAAPWAACSASAAAWAPGSRSASPTPSPAGSAEPGAHPTR